MNNLFLLDYLPLQQLTYSIPNQSLLSFFCHDSFKACSDKCRTILSKQAVKCRLEMLYYKCKGEVKGKFLFSYSNHLSRVVCCPSQLFIIRYSISDFPVFHICSNVTSYNFVQFCFDMEITFWSIDCMNTVTLLRQNPIDVGCGCW